MFRGMLMTAVGAGVVLGATALRSGAQSESAVAPKTVTVKLVDVSPTEYRFEPADITVGPGDTVRFEQAGAMPHNVEFRDVPEGTDIGAARMGPFLTAAGETYDVVIDTRFVAGVHRYVCTPHEALGMVGSITVAAGGD